MELLKVFSMRGKSKKLFKSAFRKGSKIQNLLERLFMRLFRPKRGLVKEE